MATMAAKLKGKVEVVRRLTKEKELIKKVADRNHHTTYLEDMMSDLYRGVELARSFPGDEKYSKKELYMVVDWCCSEVERQNRIFDRKHKEFLKKVNAREKKKGVNKNEGN